MWDTCTSHFGPKKFDQVGRGVREGPNIAKYAPRFWLLSPLEAPKCVQDPGNGLKSIRGSLGDHLGAIRPFCDRATASSEGELGIIEVG